MRATEFITELAYDGNVGVHEMMMFYMNASDEQKIEMKRLVAANDKKSVWALVKSVTGTQLRGQEFATEAKIMSEGGWASTATQNTIITPVLIAHSVAAMAKFAKQFNTFLEKKGMPPIEMGDPCGSATYYKRDMAQQPNKRYGDVDIHVFIPRIPDMTNNANAAMYKQAVFDFCQGSANFSTENGTNVILQLGKDFVQIDLVTAYYENRNWTRALAPEWNMKGVLCNSMYSSLGEALNLSFGGGHGIQVKTIDGVPVKFSTQKGTVLSTITNNPESWAVDIAHYLGCTRLSPKLNSFPGMIGEPRTADIAASFHGLAETLEANGKLGRYSSSAEFLNTVATIYTSKINKVISSSKFDKATTPAAVQQAADTKAMLAQKSAKIAHLVNEDIMKEECQTFTSIATSKRLPLSTIFVDF